MRSTDWLEAAPTTLEMDDGAQISLWDEGGEGTPVVLIHGFPETHQCWRGVVQRLGEAPYRLVAYDLRGFGESDKRGEASFNRLFQDHLLVVDRLGLGPYHLVGHDWGGAVALHVARYYPESLASLAVMNTNYWKTDLRGMWHLTFLNLPLLPQLVFRHFPEGLFAAVLLRSFSRPELVSDEVREAYLAMFRDEATVTYWRRLYRSMALKLAEGAVPGLRGRLHRSSIAPPPRSERAFSVPTRLIWGEEDGFNPPWIARHLSETLRQRGAKVELDLLGGAGHFVAEDQPVLVARKLLEHWDGCRR